MGGTTGICGMPLPVPFADLTRMAQLPCCCPSVTLRVPGFPEIVTARAGPVWLMTAGSI